MPLRSTAEYDPVTAIAEFKKSIVFETIVSLQGIVDSWKMQSLADEAKKALGEYFFEDTKELYRTLYACCSFAELAVDYKDQLDFPGFLRYVSDMSPRTFAFYVLGRWFPQDAIPEQVTSEAVGRLVESHEESELLNQIYPSLSWLDEIDELKNRLVEHWRTYWNGFYRKKIDEIDEYWTKSLEEKQSFAVHNGGAALITKLTGNSLPGPMPADQPYTRIDIIPLFNIPRSSIMYYGYGTIQLLYDCSRTEEHEREVDNYKRSSLSALKALADDNRLKILKLISQKERLINGKNIAEKLKLSASVVSRHLSQLKEAGLIEEHSVDNRNITYTFSLERLQSLGAEVERYIRD